MLVCPGDSPLGRDAEVCACGAQRLVNLEGKPAGIWSQMRPAPYANPVGHIDQLTQEGRCFTIDNPEDYGGLTGGAQVAALRYNVETGAVVKVQGTVTAVDQARAKFSITGPQADQETCSGKERRSTWNRLIDRDPGPSHATRTHIEDRTSRTGERAFPDRTTSRHPKCHREAQQ